MKLLVSIGVAVAAGYYFNQKCPGDGSHVVIGLVAFSCTCFLWALVTK